MVCVCCFVATARTLGEANGTSILRLTMPKNYLLSMKLPPPPILVLEVGTDEDVGVGAGGADSIGIVSIGACVWLGATLVDG